MMVKVKEFEVEDGIWLREENKEGETIREYFIPKSEKEKKVVFGPKDKVNKEEFEGHKGKWITLENGQHIFIREGEKVEDAIGRLKPKTDVKIVMDKAKKEFGTTRDFREAGWILPDGEMLDFSDRPYGGRGGSRSLDHSDINRIAPEDLGDYQGTSHYPALRWFEQKGAMRFGMYNKGSDVVVSIDVKGNYTSEQWRKLKTSVKLASDSFAYDFYDGGKLLDSKYYEKGLINHVDDLEGKYKEFHGKEDIRHPEHEPVPVT